MIEKSAKKEGKSSPREWNSTLGLRWTGKKSITFWEWFLKANDISKRDFVQELKRDADAGSALGRLFSKMNKLAVMRQKKLGTSGKGLHAW